MAIHVHRKRFPWQVFRDAKKRGAALIPFAAFLWVLPLPLIVFYDAIPILGSEWANWPPEQQAVLMMVWAAEYPLTLVFYHTLATRMQRDGFYDSPRTSVLGGITLDLFKHGVFLSLIFAFLLAADQKPNPERLIGLKNTLSLMLIAS